MKAPEPDVAAVQAYERAFFRLELALANWEVEGRPLSYRQPNHVLGVHPAWKTVREAEQDLAKAREAVRVKHRGPAPTGVISQTVGESPAARLRSAN